MSVLLLVCLKWSLLVKGVSTETTCANRSILTVEEAVDNVGDPAVVRKGLTLTVTRKRKNTEEIVISSE